MRAFVVYNKLIVNGEAYTLEEILSNEIEGIGGKDSASTGSDGKGNEREEGNTAEKKNQKGRTVSERSPESAQNEEITKQMRLVTGSGRIPSKN